MLDTDNKMSQENQKRILFVEIIVLLVHVRFLQKSKSVTLAYFPPNTTSKVQPMDPEIINYLTVNYGKSIINKVISDIEHKTTIHL